MREAGKTMSDFKALISENDKCREAYRDGISAYIQKLDQEGYEKRERFMCPDTYFSHIEEYRATFLQLLGVDKIRSNGAPATSLVRVAEDPVADIYRLTLYVTAEIPLFGLLFVPHDIEKAPLVIAQHGNGGTPELCADLNGPNKYSRMVRRAIERGAAVFAPQLLLWNFTAEKSHQRVHPIPYDRNIVDLLLKRHGMSITALEVKGIMDAITYLSDLPYVDADRIGMVGHSYGGYYTLHTMAADTRIKAGYTNACLNDRRVHYRSDWTYQDASSTFHDAEVAALCAPRKLAVTVGRADQFFDFSSAEAEGERARRYYAAAGCPQNFAFFPWEGDHSVPEAEDGFDFLFSALNTIPTVGETN